MPGTGQGRHAVDALDGQEGRFWSGVAEQLGSEIAADLEDSQTLSTCEVYLDG